MYVATGVGHIFVSSWPCKLDVRIECALRISACMSSPFAARYPPPPKCPVHAACTAATHVHTLCYVDSTICMCELVRDQLRQLLTLPACPGTPEQIVLETARPAIVVRDIFTNEMSIINAEGDKWAAWRPLARNSTEMLSIYSLCMPTPNMLLIFDKRSYSVKQYELAWRALPASTTPLSALCPLQHTCPIFPATAKHSPAQMQQGNPVGPDPQVQNFGNQA